MKTLKKIFSLDSKDSLDAAFILREFDIHLVSAESSYIKATLCIFTKMFAIEVALNGQS